MEANQVVSTKKPYYGKPANQKDPKAVAVQPPAKPKKVQKPRPDLPKTLPGPSALSEKPSPMKTSNPADETLFNNGLSVREVQSHTTFSPTLTPAVEIARDSFAEIITDNAQLGKVLLPEYYDYYSTSTFFSLQKLETKSRGSYYLGISFLAEGLNTFFFFLSRKDSSKRSDWFHNYFNL